MKTVYLITHGAKIDFKGPNQPNPNPGMTKDGWRMVASLRPKLNELLPNGPAQIHAGTGLRQSQVVEALGFDLNKVLFSALWGEPATAVKMSGKKVIVLADGRYLEWEKYLSPRHMESTIREVLSSLPDGSLICSGRPVLVRLKMEPEECFSGALYTLEIEGDQINIKLLVAGVKLLDGKEGASV